MRKIGLVVLGGLVGAALASWGAPNLQALPTAEPSMLGNWIPDSYHAAARHGQWGAEAPGGGGFGSAAQPASLTTEPDMSAWSLHFTAQKGGAFTGIATAPNGETAPVVGAFRSDGKRIVYSTPLGSGNGEVENGSMEWCFTHATGTFTSAECTIYRRAK